MLPLSTPGNAYGFAHSTQADRAVQGAGCWGKAGGAGRRDGGRACPGGHAGCCAGGNARRCRRGGRRRASRAAGRRVAAWSNAPSWQRWGRPPAARDALALAHDGPPGSRSELRPPWAPQCSCAAAPRCHPKHCVSLRLVVQVLRPCGQRPDCMGAAQAAATGLGAVGGREWRAAPMPNLYPCTPSCAPSCAPSTLSTCTPLTCAAPRRPKLISSQATDPRPETQAPSYKLKLEARIPSPQTRSPHPSPHVRSPHPFPTHRPEVSTHPSDP